MSKKKFCAILSTLRHVLVLAVDRLDYETLLLEWLPHLDKMATQLSEPSIEIQALCHLFALFMCQSEETSILPSGNEAYNREA